MAPDENNPTDPHAVACNKNLSLMQELVNEGLIEGGGMVSAYVTVVETTDDYGGSQVHLLWSDGRTTMLTGLLTVGSMMVAKNS